MKPMKVLIVDDERVSRAMFKRELQKGGYETLEASDGFQALHLIHNHQIDLVTLDIDMPDMDGYQVCSWLRGEQFNQQIHEQEKNYLPIIFITSDDSKESRLKGFRAGATDFILKGFKPGELLATVNRFLRPGNALEGLTALLVDDSQLVRELVTKMLLEQSMDVITANDGKEGYEVLARESDRIDMVITDLEMPIMNGDVFCRKIRSELNLKELPVIFLTAVPDRRVLIDLFKAGANDYLVKPFVKEELIARLRVMREMYATLAREVSERRQAEIRLAQQRELVQARETEIKKGKNANTVLHNVNNVINSISVSVAQLEGLLTSSRLPQLLLGLELIEQNKDSLAEFFTESPKGKRLPMYFHAAGEQIRDERRQLVEEVEELRKKLNLTRDVVIAQQNQNTLKQRRQEVPLVQLMDQALAVVQPILADHDVAVAWGTRDNTAVLVDPISLVHVLVNLLKNGVEAMQETAAPAFKLSVATHGESQVIATIKDNGPGIPSAAMDTIFEEGFTTKPDGHGVGLAFCAQTVAKLSGRLWAENHGQGAAFHLALPKAQA
ncbi:response regulator [Acanthopleuribacter pedis]|uniref:histidine kinase n=1 Tax=Acanthopleuribacter pedis TaxID=442870 RepID=A0A8J7QIU2_9BACT|nr:response regulator [Acanthopleuribacter pedis]MBO1318985.1 response regulator [Acanthopleuribacter pedis]